MSWRLFTQEPRTKSTTGDLQPKSLHSGAMWCAARSLGRCPSEIVVTLLPAARGKGVPGSKILSLSAQLSFGWIGSSTHQQSLFTVAVFEGLARTAIAFIVRHEAIP